MSEIANINIFTLIYNPYLKSALSNFKQPPQSSHPEN